MPIPPETLKAYEKTQVDLAIEEFASLEDPTMSDLNRVRVQADIKCQLDEYRFNALNMTEKQRLEESHSSSDLAERMTASADPRPASAEHCHCHAIISGGHGEAAVVRAVMAWCMMRIDDPRNGCWLPSNTAAKAFMPRWLKNAIPHSRIHRKTYYRWLEREISFTLTQNIGQLTDTLRIIRMRLQSGRIPPEILVDMGMEA